MLRSLTRRIERLEMLMHQCHRIERFGLSTQVIRSIDRNHITFKEWAFIARQGFVPRSLGHLAINHQLKQFVKRAPPPDHPAWQWVDDLLWYIDPMEKKNRWDVFAWDDVWRFVKTVRRMRPRRKAVESEKRAWLRKELGKLWLHMGEEKFDPKKEMQQQSSRSGRFVEAVLEEPGPPSLLRREETERLKKERRRERRAAKRAPLEARRARVREVLGKPPAIDRRPDPLVLLGGEAFG